MVVANFIGGRRDVESGTSIRVLGTVVARGAKHRLPWPHPYRDLREGPLLEHRIAGHTLKAGIIRVRALTGRFYPREPEAPPHHINGSTKTTADPILR